MNFIKSYSIGFLFGILIGVLSVSAFELGYYCSGSPRSTICLYLESPFPGLIYLPFFMLGGIPAMLGGGQVWLEFIIGAIIFGFMGVFIQKLWEVVRKRKNY